MTDETPKNQIILFDDFIERVIFLCQQFLESEVSADDHVVDSCKYDLRIYILDYIERVRKLDQKSEEENDICTAALEYAHSRGWTKPERGE